MKRIIQFAIAGAKIQRDDLLAQVDNINAFIAKHEKNANPAGPTLSRLRETLKTKRRAMSPAMRKKVSERMKKYWAQRRKAKK